MDNKKRIAFVIGSLSSGGAERVVSTLSNELIEKYSITIITFIKSKPFYPLNTKIKVVHCIDKIPPSKTIFHAVYLNVRLLMAVRRIMKNEKSDLAIGFMTSSNVMAILGAKLSGIPVVISERINPYIANTPALWRKFRKLIYPYANFLVVQTHTIKDYFSGWISDLKLVILPNPLTPDLTINENAYINKRKNIVLNVGRLTNQKGQEALIRAFGSINPQNWELVIVGEGGNKEKYQKLIDDLQIGDRVSLVGRQKNISKYYNEAKIFVFPSLFEGFPNALIEAMHMGLPCISTDCPTGPSELIDNGVNGFLIKPDNIPELEKHLKLLMGDANLREKFSKMAKKTVEPYKVENVIKKWDEIISSLIK